jgi:ankyrin repeat protein
LLMVLQYGVTLVHWAVKMGHNNTTEMLIKAGADVNVADKVKVIFLACVCAFHGDSVF